jgi:hypothetical protein
MAVISAKITRSKYLGFAINPYQINSHQIVKSDGCYGKLKLNLLRICLAYLLYFRLCITWPFN